MGLRKIFMGEVISPSSSTGRIFRRVFEVVGHFVFLIAVVLIVPYTFAAIALLCAGTIIVIRRKTYSDFGLTQGRGAVLIGAFFLLAGGVLAAYTIFKA